MDMPCSEECLIIKTLLQNTRLTYTIHNQIKGKFTINQVNFNYVTTHQICFVVLVVIVVVVVVLVVVVVGVVVLVIVAVINLVHVVVVVDPRNLPLKGNISAKQNSV